MERQKEGKLYLCVRLFGFVKRSIKVFSIDNKVTSLRINGLIVNKHETDT